MRVWNIGICWIKMAWWAESQVIRLVDNNDIYARLQIFDFRVSEIKGEEWQINFSTLHYPECTVRTKRETDVIRIFSRLNGVEQFLRKVGVKEFKVTIC